MTALVWIAQFDRIARDLEHASAGATDPTLIAWAHDTGTVRYCIECARKDAP